MSIIDEDGKFPINYYHYGKDGNDYQVGKFFWWIQRILDSYRENEENMDSCRENEENMVFHLITNGLLVYFNRNYLFLNKTFKGMGEGETTSWFFPTPKSYFGGVNSNDYQV